MRELRLERAIHFTMALCGGFLGAYAVFNRLGILANAQTANLLELVNDLIGRDLPQVSLRLGALFVYLSSLSLSVIMERKWGARFQPITLATELAAVAVVGFIPEQTNPFLALYPLCFVTALQWCAFPGADGFTSANVFSTNNTKQTVISATQSLLDRKTDPEHSRAMKKKAAFYGKTLLSFHTGAAISILSGRAWGVRSVWLCSLPLLAALYMVHLLARQAGKKHRRFPPM